MGRLALFDVWRDEDGPKGDDEWWLALRSLEEAEDRRDGQVTGKYANPGTKPNPSPAS